MDWKPIESAPRDRPVLGFDPTYSGGFVYVIEWCPGQSKEWYPGAMAGSWREAGGEQYERFEPTHWMPLPPPPQ